MNQAIGDNTFLRLTLAAAAGIITFMLVSWLTGGIFIFIEVALAALAAYIVARR